MSFKEKLEFSTVTKRVLYDINISRDVLYTYLKPGQFDCIQSVLQTDTIGVLPTGYGKSLIFEMLPYFTNAPIFVITPLNSIISEQVARYGRKAVHFSDRFISLVDGSVKPVDNKEFQMVADFQSGNIKYLIGHPEQFISKSAFAVFKNSTWKNSVSHIVIDEAHCVVQWGVGFRQKFQELIKLRSLFPTALVLALSATATTKMRKEIVEILGLKNCGTVFTNVNRENIKIEVKSRPAGNGKCSVEQSYDFVFQPLIEELIAKKENFEKTIVYTKLKWCGYGSEEVVRPQFNGMDNNLKDYVAQYHSPCTPAMKQNVLESMADPGSNIRLLFATEAYSMGTDAPDVRRIIHAGVPTTLETYIQEVGRAGRDGQPAVARLFFNKMDISKTAKGMTEEMQKFCELQSCRREFICNHFGFSNNSEFKLKHLCCDNCEKSCDCDSCVIERDDMVSSDGNISKESSRLDKSVIDHIKTSLECYFVIENQLLGCPNASVLSGLSLQLAEVISKDYSECGNVDYLTTKFPLLKLSYAENICSIVQAILS